MSVESEILRIQHNIADTYAAVAEKGGEVPLQLTSANLAAAINSIPIGAGIQTLKVISPPKYTAYAAGEKFDMTGLEAHGVFSNGIELPIPNELLSVHPETIGPSTTAAAVVFQWNGDNAATAAFPITVQAYPHAMNACTWAQLGELSANNQFAKYYSVGDAKEFKMTWQYSTPYLVNQTMSCIVIGVNHNSAKEGSNRLHCMITVGNSADKVLTDDKYGNIISSSSTNSFSLNYSATNVGGFPQTTLNTKTLVSLRNSLPAELRNVMKTVTKWDDTGNGSDSTTSAITSHSYNITVPSSIEICGSGTANNVYEKNYQSQYSYFSGLGGIRFKKRSGDEFAKISTRTRYLFGGTEYFDCIDESGKPGILNPKTDVGLLPLIFI